MSAAAGGPPVPQAPPPPAPPATEVPVATFERAGWHFEAAAVPLWQSTRIDELGRMEQLCKVPDMFCGDASLRVSHPSSGLCLELNATDALRCCRWKPPPPPSLQPEVGALTKPEDGVVGSEKGGAAAEQEGPLLGAVRCQFAGEWKPKNDHPDVKEFKVTSDWTCSSPYWGRLSLTGEEEPQTIPEEFITETDEGLPMELLRRRDEIHWYNEVLFWEDELDDNGVCRSSVRVRVMPSFWFALLLCELRVDGVLVREVGTRFFHQNGSDHVLREWTWKEATYDSLRDRGIKPSECPHISQSSVGTMLLEHGDVQRQLRHRISLKRGAAEGVSATSPPTETAAATVSSA